MSHLHPDQLTAIALDPTTAEDSDHDHIDECARCARELDVLRSVSSRARRAQPDDTPPAPPEDVWDRVVHELTESGDLPTTRQRERPRLAGRSWAIAAALIAIVVVGAAALLQIGTATGTAIAEARLEALADVQPARATLLADGEDRTLRLDTDGLPQTDGYYEVWLLASDESGLVSLGPVTPGQRYEVPSAIDVDRYSIVDISREPTDGDPTHSTDSVLRGELEPVA
jgi:hypothetical protein